MTDSGSSYEDYAPSGTTSRSGKRMRDESDVTTNGVGRLQSSLGTHERVRRWEKKWVHVKHLTLFKWVPISEDQQPKRVAQEPETAVDVEDRTSAGTVAENENSTQLRSNMQTEGVSTVSDQIQSM